MTSGVPGKQDEKRVYENNNIEIKCAKIGKQQADNLNVFTQNLANHTNRFLNRLEEANKNGFAPVAEIENSKPSCSKAIANNGDTK